jgi:ParB/RepB/Spo0J family partition protein
MQTSEFKSLQLALIESSLTNPRKTFNEAKLSELSISIQASGVHQPILVRPLPASRVAETSIDASTGKPRKVKPAYEVVCGERRYRASKMAGFESIPALVRDLSDSQVLEIQIVENLQRDDLSELEEAEGYEALMQHSGLTADQVGEKIGKSRSYVYGRLKLLDLCQEARGGLRDRTIDASRALLVARIPDHKLQIKAMKEILSGGSYYTNEPLSYRRAAEHVQRNYMLKLSEATFKITAADLVPDAGSCKTCTKRTGHDPDLFSDVKGADVCTDPVCFHKKEEAHVALKVEEAKAKGQTVIIGKEALELAQNTYGNTKFKGYKRLDSVEDSPADVPLRKLIGAQMKAQGIKPVMIEHPTKKGEMVECLPNEVAGKLLKALEGQAAAAKEVSKEVKALMDDKKAKAEAKAKDQFEKQWRAALLRDAWSEVRDDAGIKAFNAEVHRYLVVQAAHGLSTDNASAICEILNLGKVSPISAVVDFAKETPSPDALHLLIIMQSDSGAFQYSFRDQKANEGLMLVAGNVFGDQLASVIKEIKLETKAKVWPKPEKSPSANGPAARAKKGAGGKGPKKPGRSAAHLSAEEATLGIAEAMQGLEGSASAPEGAVAPTVSAEAWPFPKSKEDRAKAEEASKKAVGALPLYDKAVELVTKEQKASKRLLKEGLGIGQDKAQALLVELETNGVVSAVDESRNRRVLVAA